MTAYFPFGLVKDLVYDPSRELWQTRFLVPKSVPDGLYHVPVVILHKDGRTQELDAVYRIDSAAPDFETHVSASEDGATLEVVASEALREVVVVRADRPQVRVYLDRALRGLVWKGTLALPPGTHRLRVVATDDARNEADELVTVEVK